MVEVNVDTGGHNPELLPEVHTDGAGGHDFANEGACGTTRRLEKLHHYCATTSKKSDAYSYVTDDPSVDKSVSHDAS